MCGGDDEHEVGMLEYILRNGGGTFGVKDYEPRQFADGYSVGIEFGTFKKIAISDLKHDLDVQDVFDEIIKEYDDVDYVGAWVSDGFVHFDPVEIYDGYRDAVLSGLANGQQEIYSFKDGESINVVDAWHKIVNEEE